MALGANERPVLQRGFEGASIRLDPLPHEGAGIGVAGGVLVKHADAPLAEQRGVEGQLEQLARDRLTAAEAAAEQLDLVDVGRAIAEREQRRIDGPRSAAASRAGARTCTKAPAASRAAESIGTASTRAIQMSGSLGAAALNPSAEPPPRSRAPLRSARRSRSA